jgi:hypothetical protein
VTETYVPAASSDGGDYLAVWDRSPEGFHSAVVVAWRVEDGQVVEGVGIGGSSAVIWLPAGRGVVDLISGRRWASEVEWREDKTASSSSARVERSTLRPTLSPEYRVRLRLPSGFETFRPCADLAEAEARAARTVSPQARATVERRLCGPWSPSEPRRGVLGALEALRPSSPVPGGSNGASG